MRAAQTCESPVAAGPFAENAQTAAIIGTTAADDKAFATLRAQLALLGHTLHRTHPGDGPQAFYAECWGMVRNLPTVEHVRAFYKQIGGAA